MKNYKKIVVLFIVVGLLFVLTSCGGSIEKPITTNTKNWFDWILVIPIGWIMQFFSGIAGNNFGVGIIITTIIIRTIAWPIYAKSNDLSLKMSIAQPEMQRVQAKYAGRQDRESQQKMQMEMSQIYKKYNINLFGCLMPFLQMPIFIAVYQVVQRIYLENGIWAHKVANKFFLGINLDKAGNLTFFRSGQTGDLAGWILAILVAGTNFLLNYLAMKKPSYQKQTASHGYQSDEAMQSQKMMKYMQVFMIVMMFGLSLQSNSLALYWVVGNTYSIGQNLINRKINEVKYEKMKNEDLVVKS